MKLLDNNNSLYKPDKQSWKSSLEYAKTLKENNSKLIFHCLWRVPKDFGRKQVAVLKSIIVNHIGKDFEINLWSNVDLSDNVYFKEVSSFVKLNIWDIKREVKNTILEDSPHINSVDDEYCYLEGDVFRLLVLYKYGGFYIDMDVLVLRDLSPLNQMQFLYQWGTSGFNQNEPTITMNGAVMRLDSGSELALEFLNRITETPPIRNTTTWGTQLYSKVKSEDLLVLPCIWFNSEWGFEDTLYSPFKKIEKTELFEGAFTWHWHNRWDDEVEEGCKFEILEKKHNEEFKKMI